MRRKFEMILLGVCICLSMACTEVDQTPGESSGEPGQENITPGVTKVPDATQAPGATETPEATAAPKPLETPVVSASKEEPLAFSRYSGVYEDEFLLAMAAYETGAEIYYTLDGSDPKMSTTAMKYSEYIHITDRKKDANVMSAVNPLLIAGSFNYVTSSGTEFGITVDTPTNEAVDKCTVVRAVAKNADGTYSEEVSATYFIGTMEEHINGIAESCKAAGTTLSVISIATDYDNFFNHNNGIYVKGRMFEYALKTKLAGNGTLKDGEEARSLDANYKHKGRSWEREVRVSFFECDENGATEVLAQTCGIRVQGNYSRSDLQKGLRLYAREEYGEKNFKYAFFGEDYVNVNGEVMDKFKTLVLRNGGNCAFTSKFNDTYWQSLVASLDCGTQKSRPCIVYLNGEYWGLYVLQEDYTDNHMENLYGVDNKDVVIYKGDAETLELGYKLDVGDVPEGESESYYFEELLDFFETHKDLKAQSDYEAFCKLVDPQSVLDYFAVQAWIDNKWDWPGKNWSMWKTTSSDGKEDSYGDGRWRFLFYDMEFGGVCGASDAKNNTIKNANYKTYGLLDFETDNPAVLTFAYLMTNDKFRAEYIERLTGLSDGLLKKETALEKLAYFEAVYGPLYEQFFERYPGTGEAESALEGGYATARCIRDFLGKRSNYIKPMVDYIVKVRGN